MRSIAQDFCIRAGTWYWRRCRARGAMSRGIGSTSRTSRSTALTKEVSSPMRLLQQKADAYKQGCFPGRFVCTVTQPSSSWRALVQLRSGCGFMPCVRPWQLRRPGCQEKIHRASAVKWHRQCLLRSVYHRLYRLPLVLQSPLSRLYSPYRPSRIYRIPCRAVLSCRQSLPMRRCTPLQARRLQMGPQYLQRQRLAPSGRRGVTPHPSLLEPPYLRLAGALRHPSRPFFLQLPRAR